MKTSIHEFDWMAFQQRQQAETKRKYYRGGAFSALEGDIWAYEVQLHTYGYVPDYVLFSNPREYMPYKERKELAYAKGL